MSAEQLVQLLVAGGGDAAALRAAEQELLGMMSAPLMQSLIRASRTAPQPAAKRIALLIERVRSPAAFPVLEEMLRTTPIRTDDPLTLAALHTLAVTGTPYAAAVLARRLDQAQTPEEEAILSRALATVSSLGTESELIAIAHGRQDATRPATRIGAVRALANYASPEVLSTLTKLTADPDPAVAAAAQAILASPPAK